MDSMERHIYNATPIFIVNKIERVSDAVFDACEDSLDVRCRIGIIDNTNINETFSIAKMATSCKSFEDGFDEYR